MSMLFSSFKSRLVLRIIPETTPTRYIGGYSALNLHMPDTSGDWHQPDYIYCPEDSPLTLAIFGEGVENADTNHIFGDYGIIESAEELKAWGFAVNYPQVFRSNHFRTILDMLYFDLMTYELASRLPFITQGATIDFLNNEEQQQVIFDKSMLIKPYLPPERIVLLDAWLGIEKRYENG